MSALYLGTGNKEKKLLDTLNKSLEKNPNVKCNLLFDYTRSNRKENGFSSKDLLKTSLSNSQANISFFLSPWFSKWFNKKFILPRDKQNEIVSLQHMKVFVLDDDVMLSGANLSHQYFTNRIDRYIVFKNSKPLADFLDEIVKTVSTFSYQLHSDGKLSLHETWKHHPISASDKPGFIKEARKRIEGVKSRYDQDSKDIFEVQDKHETFVMPFMQMRHLNIRDEETFLAKFLSSPPSGSRIRLASGYFNLTQVFKNKLLSLKNDVKCDVLMASEDVNSFKGAKGLMGSIPSFYTTMSLRFWNDIQRNSKENIRLFSFFRPNWTFHAKGLWIENPVDQTLLATIGSSNFGYRSVERDLEMQVVLVTRNQNLQTRLRNEHQDIWNNAKIITSNEDFPKVSTWVSIISRFIKTYF
jgi:CDP-diacylglycerol--glycerol-3-phosphate 3-phosphatidyltransferase